MERNLTSTVAFGSRRQSRFVAACTLSVAAMVFAQTTTAQTYPPQPQPAPQPAPQPMPQPAPQPQPYPQPAPQPQPYPQPQPQPQQPAYPPAATAPQATPVPNDFADDQEILSSYAVRAGQISIGLGLNLNFTGQLQQQAFDNTFPFSSSLFASAVPQISYYPIDRVEVVAFAGGLLRNVPRFQNETSLALDGLVGVNFGYHFPVTDRVLLIGSVGVGATIGISGHNQWTVPATGDPVKGTGTDLTTPFGALAYVRGGAGYMLSRYFEIRAEAEAIGRGGAESIASANQFVFGGTINTGVRISVNAYF